MNQCQGCQAGWELYKAFSPIKEGHYRMVHIVKGGYPGERVACTAHRYKEDTK